MLCIKIIYFLLTQTTCTTVVVFEPRGQGSQIFFDACINQIGVEINLATVTVCDCECQCHSLSVDTFARWRARGRLRTGHCCRKRQGSRCKRYLLDRAAFPVSDLGER